MEQENPNSSYISSLLNLSKGAHEFKASKQGELVKIDLKLNTQLLLYSQSSYG